MLEILSAPCLSPSIQMFEEDVTGAVQEDHKTFDKLCRRKSGCEARDHGVSRLDVPRPTAVGKGTHPAPESKDAVPKEYGAFDGMRQSREDETFALLFLSA
jgi:hypothetical protein